MCKKLTDDELDDLSAVAQSHYLDGRQSVLILNEIRGLRAWKIDMEESMKTAADDSCDMNERHCTCVPLLRAEIKRLQAYPAAVNKIRSYYPVDIFPENGGGTDCVSARFARALCDQIHKEAAKAKEKP